MLLLTATRAFLGFLSLLSLSTPTIAERQLSDPTCSCTQSFPPSCAVAPINNQTQLFIALAVPQSTEVNVVVASGTYTCDTAGPVNGSWVACTPGDGKCGACDNANNDNTRMYTLVDRYGSISCADNLECVLNGQDSRSVMRIKGTSGKNLALRGFVFSNGYHASDGGAGVAVTAVTTLSFSQVTIEISEFRSNSADSPSTNINVFGGALLS